MLGFRRFPALPLPCCSRVLPRFQSARSIHRYKCCLGQRESGSSVTITTDGAQGHRHAPAAGVPLTAPRLLSLPPSRLYSQLASRSILSPNRTFPSHPLPAGKSDTFVRDKSLLLSATDQVRDRHAPPLQTAARPTARPGYPCYRPHLRHAPQTAPRSTPRPVVASLTRSMSDLHRPQARRAMAFSSPSPSATVQLLQLTSNDQQIVVAGPSCREKGMGLKMRPGAIYSLADGRKLTVATLAATTTCKCSTLSVSGMMKKHARVQLTCKCMKYHARAALVRKRRRPMGARRP